MKDDKLKLKVYKGKTKKKKLRFRLIKDGEHIVLFICNKDGEHLRNILVLSPDGEIYLPRGEPTNEFSFPMNEDGQFIIK